LLLIPIEKRQGGGRKSNFKQSPRPHARGDQKKKRRAPLCSSCQKRRRRKVTKVVPGGGKKGERWAGTKCLHGKGKEKNRRYRVKIRPEKTFPPSRSQKGGETAAARKRRRLLLCEKKSAKIEPLSSNTLQGGGFSLESWGR